MIRNSDTSVALTGAINYRRHSYREQTIDLSAKYQTLEVGKLQRKPVFLSVDVST